MKKVFLLILFLVILIFVFYQKRDSHQPAQTPVKVKLNEEKPIVKSVDKLSEKVETPKEESKKTYTEKNLEELDHAVLKRMKECLKNDLLYKNKKIDPKNLEETITDFFDEVLRRTEAEDRFREYIRQLETKETFNLIAFSREISSLEICRGINTLTFLDKLIETKNVNVSLLLRKINNVILAGHFSEENLALVFGKLSRMNSLGLLPTSEVKEYRELRDRFLKQIGDFSNNIKKLENDDLAQGIFLEHYNNLREVGLNLRELLDRMSYY